MKHAILSLLLLTTLISCSSNKVSTYDIKPTKSGLHHPIIGLIDQSGGFKCTAFVVSDNVAITAGHCMDYTAEYIKEILPRRKESIAKSNEKLKQKLEEIKADCFKDACVPMVAQMTKAIIYNTELLIQLEEITTPDMYLIIDNAGKNTKVAAMAAYKNSRRDFGIVIGDFRGFEKLRVQTGFNLKTGDILRSCGFPGGTTPAQCVDFTVGKMNDFEIAGTGILIPGMSGGPVLDEDGVVVGINVSVNGENVNIAPTIGILSVK